MALEKRIVLLEKQGGGSARMVVIQTGEGRPIDELMRNYLKEHGVSEDECIFFTMPFFGGDRDLGAITAAYPISRPAVRFGNVLLTF